jgi:hypothetical protein
MEVTILIPRNVDGDESCSNVSITNDVMNANDVVLVLLVHRSRVLWRGLHPCLFSKNRKAARALLQIVLQQFPQVQELKKMTKKNGNGSRNNAMDTTQNLLSNESKEEGSDDSLVDQLQSPRPFRRRRLRLAFDTDTDTTNNSSISKDAVAYKIVLWIQPPLETHIEPYFSGLLMKYEHELMQAQSLAAYFATLGGGFFLCRHLKTALTLARQQQRMAVFLGDTGMYYRCLINQAYNYIYAGQFKVANQLIQQVRAAATATTLLKRDDVLIQMCASARLFSKRVRKARQTPVTKEQQQQSLMTKDDLYRIRMVQDQSLPSTDVTAPFRRK